MQQFEELGFKGLKAGCSKVFTLYDKLRQQRDEKDRFRQADEAAADLCGRHHPDRQVLGVWSDPDRVLALAGVDGGDDSDR